LYKVDEDVFNDLDEDVCEQRPMVYSWHGSHGSSPIQMESLTCKSFGTVTWLKIYGIRFFNPDDNALFRAMAFKRLHSTTTISYGISAVGSNQLASPFVPRRIFSVAQQGLLRRHLTLPSSCKIRIKVRAILLKMFGSKPEVFVYLHWPKSEINARNGGGFQYDFIAHIHCDGTKTYPGKVSSWKLVSSNSY